MLMTARAEQGKRLVSFALSLTHSLAHVQAAELSYPLIKGW